MQAAQTPHDSHAVAFDDVSFSYDDETNALQGLSFAVEHGEYVAIVGGNGSGKSTVAQMMNGVMVPDSGDVTVMGLNTKDPQSRYEVRKLAGLVFQDPDDQMITSVVADDVAFGPENLGLPPAEIRNRVQAALAAVGMQDAANRETAGLSGGQKQRVAIAGILAMDPQVLVLDEPGAMLDPRGRKDISRVSHELNERGITVVLVTHFMDEAMRADRIIVLDKGAVATQGTPEEVFTQHELMESLRLEEPFSVQLTAALRERGVYVPFLTDEEALQEALFKVAHRQDAARTEGSCR